MLVSGVSLRYNLYTRPGIANAASVQFTTIEDELDACKSGNTRIVTVWVAVRVGTDARYASTTSRYTLALSGDVQSNAISGIMVVISPVLLLTVNRFVALDDTMR